MAKSKTKTKPAKESRSISQTSKSPEELYNLAIASLETSDLQEALQHAQNLLRTLDPDISIEHDSDHVPKSTSVAALQLLGEICIELGDADTARKYFLLAVKGDPHGSLPDEEGGGASKFFWLAQLSDQGGADSVKFFQHGVLALKAQIETLEQSSMDTDEKDLLLLDKRAKIATALCSVSEIYMTDLSWDDNAESQCEALVTEALMLAPENAEVLQTVASVRLSQSRVEDAQSALKRSLSLWSELDPEDDDVPAFAARVSLARLLMDANLEEDAMDVLQRLALEDDQSVEACYLGGWCLHLLANKADDEEPSHETLGVSRTWLLNTMRLYEKQEYEDDRLRDHALELLAKLEAVLGPVGDTQAEDEIDWEQDEESDQDEMTGIVEAKQ